MTQRGVDMVVACCSSRSAGLTMYDSYQVGIGWEGGPQSGYFPFYIGAAVACERRHPGPGESRRRTESFVDWAELQART